MFEGEKGPFQVNINLLISRAGATVTWSHTWYGNLVALISVDNHPKWKVIHGNLVPRVTVTWSRPSTDSCG